MSTKLDSLATVLVRFLYKGLSGRIGKHTDELAQALVVNTEGKTACHQWQTDGWDGYARQLPEQVTHEVSKALTQRLEAEQWNPASTDRTLASATE